LFGAEGLSSAQTVILCCRESGVWMNIFFGFIATLCFVESSAWAINENCEGRLRRAEEIFVEDSISVTGEINHYFSDKKVVAILGSSKIGEDSDFYSLTHNIAYGLGLQGFTILTGGGPGLMDAANKGASEAKAYSVGFEVNAPWARHATEYIDKLFVFENVQERKKVIMSVADVFVFMPGGIGTLDEFFTIIGAIYSGQLGKKPVILVGKKFWEPLFDFLTRTLVVDHQTAKSSDFNFIQIVESADEVFEILGR
jgi:uncharacterized protein (TIGR00730 family)